MKNNIETFNELDQELFEIVSSEKYRTLELIGDYEDFLDNYDKTKNFNSQDLFVREIINKIRNVKKG